MINSNEKNIQHYILKFLTYLKIINVSRASNKNMNRNGEFTNYYNGIVFNISYLVEM